jgi:hypothetical protein
MRRRSLLLTGLLVSTAACAHRHGAAGDSEPPPPLVTVVVTNNYQSSMEIYVVGAGTSYHLGSVAPGVPRSFALRRNLVASGGHVYFYAQATGAGPRVQSDDLFLSPGDVVEFEITTQLVGSRATVRP